MNGSTPYYGVKELQLLDPTLFITTNPVLFFVEKKYYRVGKSFAYTPISWFWYKKKGKVMSLFKDPGPEFYNESDRDIIKKMQNFYAESFSINHAFWSEADIDTRFAVGDQTLWNDLGYGNLPANRRRQFNFNRIRRVVNMISGHQRRYRKSTVVTPVENGDVETADQFTKVIMWNDQQEGVLETISEAFEGALVTGMNLLQVWVDYRSDPVSGNIKVDNCSYNGFLIDPFFRKADLSDCNALWKRSFVTKKECISLLKDREEEINQISGNYTKDDKFQFMPETYGYGMTNLLTYDEFYYKAYRTQRMLVDTNTGETLEWRSNDEERLKLYLRTYPEVTVVDQEIPTVRVAIVVQGKVLYDGPNPLGIDSYPFIPVFGYYNPQVPYFPWRVQGVVRGLRDAQYLYNRRKIIELDILESQINSGWIYKENALVNPKDVFLSGQGRGLAIKEDAQMTDVQQIVAPQVPPSMIQLSELLGREIQEISGVNEELLGSATDDKAGILSMLRQGAGLTTLQTLFDQLDRSQKLLGKLRIDVIQANFTPGKVQRIIEQQPTQQFYNKAFGKYDAAVEEGMNTTTQRQMQFAQLLQLKEVGVPVPNDTLLESCTLQNKKKLLESIMAAEKKQQQMQELQFQVSMEELKARTELSNARAVADQGLGLERVSRVQENKALAVERQAAAAKDQEAAFLDMVKALKEIDDIDIDQVTKMIALQKMMKEQEAALVQEPTKTQEVKV